MKKIRRPVCLFKIQLKYENQLKTITNHFIFREKSAFKTIFAITYLPSLMFALAVLDEFQANFIGNYRTVFRAYYQVF